MATTLMLALRRLVPWESNPDEWLAPYEILAALGRVSSRGPREAQPLYALLSRCVRGGVLEVRDTTDEETATERLAHITQLYRPARRPADARV